MEDVFDKIEAAINAFDTLIAFKKKFPKYSMNDNLDRMYDVKEDKVFKDFVKLVVNFLKTTMRNKSSLLIWKRL